MSNQFKIAVLAGDGIGPEVMAQAVRVLHAVEKKFSLVFEFAEHAVGGMPLTHTVKLSRKKRSRLVNSPMRCSSVRLAALGNRFLRAAGTRGAASASQILRPVCQLATGHLSSRTRSRLPLRPQSVEGGFDILCVRELTGGLYFGEPKYIKEEGGEQFAVDTMVYWESEIRRIAKVAFEAARRRKGRVTSVDKANVLQNGVLWRRVVDQLSRDYRDVSLSHLYVDNAAMQVVKNPRAFDVILTENLFGDILSDEVAMLTGSACYRVPVWERRSRTARFGLYEPSGGSAPDIAGKGIANPIAQILSAAMMLHSAAAKRPPPR